MTWDKTKDELREETARTANKKKKTAKWCRGKVGVEHVTEIVVNHNYTALRICGWREIFTRRGGGVSHWRWHYSCKHSLKCIKCGKYVEYFLKPEQCPDVVPMPPHPADRPAGWRVAGG